MYKRSSVCVKANKYALFKTTLLGLTMDDDFSFRKYVKATHSVYLIIALKIIDIYHEISMHLSFQIKLENSLGI